MIKFLKKLINSNKIIYFLLFISGFFYFFSQINFLVSYLSVNGNSPLLAIYSSLDPVVSKIDWYIGGRNFEKSLPQHIYFWFHNYTNFNLINVMKGYIFLEIYLLLFAHYYFFKTIIKKNIPALSFIFTIIVSFSP